LPNKGKDIEKKEKKEKKKRALQLSAVLTALKEQLKVDRTNFYQNRVRPASAITACLSLARLA
jgi:hypothetical protein